MAKKKARRLSRKELGEMYIVDQYLRELHAGKKGGPDDFLQRHRITNPSQTLRNRLEGSKLAHDEFARFRRKYPGVDLGKLLGVPMARSRRRTS